MFQIQITRIPYIQLMECASLVLPLLYDMQVNATQLAERREQPSIVLATVSNHLRRFAELNQQQSECTLFPAIRDLLMNLVLPTDPPMPQQQQQHQQQQQMMGGNQMMNAQGPMGGNMQVGPGGQGPVGVNVMNPNMGNF